MNDLPPPPPGYSPPKTRPKVVTKYAVYTILVCTFCMAVGVVNIVYWQPSGLPIGIVAIVIGAMLLIPSFGLLLGQSWALKYSGYAKSQWAQASEVREYFNQSPPQPIYPSTPPPGASSTPTCPTCGNSLRYVQQYQRWYCDKEQKYV